MFQSLIKKIIYCCIKIDEDEVPIKEEDLPIKKKQKTNQNNVCFNEDNNKYYLFKDN